MYSNNYQQHLYGQYGGYRSHSPYMLSSFFPGSLWYPPASDYKNSGDMDEQWTRCISSPGLESPFIHCSSPFLSHYGVAMDLFLCYEPPMDRLFPSLVHSYPSLCSVIFMEKKTQKYLLVAASVLLATLIIVGVPIVGTKVAGIQFDPIINGGQPDYFAIDTFGDGDIFTSLGYETWTGVWGYSSNSDKAGWQSCTSVGLGKGAHAQSGIIGHLCMTITEPGTYTLGIDDDTIFGDCKAQRLYNPVILPSRSIVVSGGYQGKALVDSMVSSPNPAIVGQDVTFSWHIQNTQLLYNQSLVIYKDGVQIKSREVMLTPSGIYAASEKFTVTGEYSWKIRALLLNQTWLISETKGFVVNNNPGPVLPEIEILWGDIPSPLVVGTPFCVDVWVDIPATVQPIKKVV